MKFGLKKLVRGASKIVRKNRKGLRRVAGLAVGALTPSIVQKAASVAKSVGAKRVGKTTVREIIPALKVAQGTPRPRARGKAERLPGGAPVSPAPRKRRSRATTRRRAPKKSATRKRMPPKGGKDFKALSASWKAAGKPGTWQAWVKNN